MNNLAHIAKMLDQAALDASEIEQLSARFGPFSLAEAYEIQRLSIGRRFERGEVAVGIKMGFTSQAKMQQMGVSDLIWGVLTDRMAVASGGTLDFSRFIHPRAEPEIAFLLGSSLSGIVSVDEARASVVAVAPAIEIIDSRYRNFRFSLEDVVADNCSSAAFVVGDWVPLPGDISNLGMTLSVDGEVVERGSSREILEDPVNSLIHAARLAGEAGSALQAGHIVLAGAATAAIAVASGQRVRVDVEGIGHATFDTGTAQHG